MSQAAAAHAFDIFGAVVYALPTGSGFPERQRIFALRCRKPIEE